MSFASLRGVIRRARKGLCPSCSKTKYPQLEAAGANHVGCLMYTVETHGHLVKDEHDVTAVHVAARKGHVSILVYLVDSGIVDPTLQVQARNGATPAHDAAGTGHLECLRFLFSRTSAGPNDLDFNQATPLHWAVQSGHLKVVQWLIAEARAPLDVAAKNGVTPLHLAAAKNRLDALRWMVAYAFRHQQHPMRLVNAKDRNGATPLYHAAHAGHLSIIQWLAEKGGGDPTVSTKQGLAPLHAATVAGHLECVQYLFRYGRATAPGGIRTTEGACALHFAAAEGHFEIAQWLLQQQECTGNERDYFQSTPLHDAAESGSMRVIKLLCDNGADVMLPDVEGNRAIDMARKNKHSKCVNYLEQVMKKAPRINGSVMPRNAKLQRSRQSQGQMRDNFHGAPPHLMPVNAFEEDDDTLLSEGNSDNQWVTLHDLMNKDEIEKLSQEQDMTVNSKKTSDAEIKRKLFEMNLAREQQERQKMKQELRKRQAEEEKKMKKKFSQGYHDVGEAEALESLMSLDLAVEKELTQPNHTKGNVGKIAAAFDSKKGGSKFRKFLGRKAASSGSSSLPQSHSWDSGHLRGAEMKASAIHKPRRPSADPHDYWSGVPTAPPLPSMEFLLGKKSGKRVKPGLPMNLKEELKQRVRWGRDAYDDNEADSDDNKPLSTTAQKLKQKRKKQLQPSEEENDQLRAKKSSSSPRRPHRSDRVPTPRPGMPANFPVSDLPIPRRLTYEESSPLPPSQNPPPSPKVKISSEAGRKVARIAPQPPTVPNAPIAKAASARLKGPKHSTPQNSNAHSVPQQLMTSLNQALAHSNHVVPKVLSQPNYHQASHTTESSKSTDTGNVAMAMQHRMPDSIHPSHPPLQRQTAFEEEAEDSDDSSFTSTSESSSESDDSSDESDHIVQARQSIPFPNTARPIMARNMGLHAARMARQAMQRMKNQRYPSIFRKPIIKLGTINEVLDEIIYQKNTIMEQVLVFDQIKTKRRYMFLWKQYIRMLRISRKKAERMAQRKRKAVLATAFYAWVQAKNVHDVEIADKLEMATKYYETELKRAMLKKWKAIAVKKHRSLTLEKTERRYLQWINSQLMSSGHPTVDNLDKSLASGVAIIFAIEHASKKKAPKFKLNPKHKLHKLDNWKVAHMFMRQVGIRVRDFEPADLANLQEASIHNMFNCILKWQERTLKSSH